MRICKETTVVRKLHRLGDCEVKAGVLVSGYISKRKVQREPPPFSAHRGLWIEAEEIGLPSRESMIQSYRFRWLKSIDPI
jgi:hypothetical protein